VKRFTPDLLLLDIMLPHGVDGFDICRSLNESPNRIPVIILSARGQKEDRIRGLTLGADDYVTKPFALDELLARVHAVMRRTKPRIDQLTLGNTVIDFRRLRAYCGAKPVELTLLAGGLPAKSDPCEAMAEHGFFGIESEAVDKIAGFVKKYSK
jgi:two-component system OmpR family response regulator